MLLPFENPVLGVEWFPGRDIRLSRHRIFLFCFVFTSLCTVLDGPFKLVLEDYLDPTGSPPKFRTSPG